MRDFKNLLDFNASSFGLFFFLFYTLTVMFWKICLRCFCWLNINLDSIHAMQRSLGRISPTIAECDSNCDDVIRLAELRRRKNPWFGHHQICQHEGSLRLWCATVYKCQQKMCVRGKSFLRHRIMNKKTKIWFKFLKSLFDYLLRALCSQVSLHSLTPPA